MHYFSLFLPKHLFVRTTSHNEHGSVEHDGNPLVTNGLSYRYHLGESIFILGASGIFFNFYFFFFMKIMSANRIVPDGTPRFAASHLGLLCLPMLHKKDTRPI